MFFPHKEGTITCFFFFPKKAYKCIFWLPKSIVVLLESREIVGAHILVLKRLH